MGSSKPRIDKVVCPYNIMDITGIIIIIVLILSIVLHEVAHGYAANWLGDPTARLAGRLTLNPLKHIDPIGSIVVPGLLFLSQTGLLFGWAKPVPYNPYNLTNQKWGEAIVAVAGPGTNLLLAFIFGTIIRFSEAFQLSSASLHIFGYIVFINILLALFNLIPVPPLDGSKVILPFLPFGLAMKYRELGMWMSRYGFIVLLIVFYFLIQIIWPYLLYAIVSIGSLFTGLSALNLLNLITG